MKHQAVGCFRVRARFWVFAARHMNGLPPQGLLLTENIARAKGVARVHRQRMVQHMQDFHRIDPHPALFVTHLEDFELMRTARCFEGDLVTFDLADQGTRDRRRHRYLVVLDVSLIDTNDLIGLFDVGV